MPLYTKPPHSVAFRQLAVYCIQLPRFRRTRKDFGDPLHCWLYALDRAARGKISMGEVVGMDTRLQRFAEADAGFRQFCERYGRVAADPKTRNEYYDWIDGQLHEWGIKEAAREEGERRGKRLGELHGRMAIAGNLLGMGLTPEQVAEASELPLDEVMKLSRS